MSWTTINYGAHIAELDEQSGLGGLVMPAPADDMADPAPGDAGPLSLHEASWHAAMCDLAERGWSPGEDEEGELVYLTGEGEAREVLALVHESCTLDPIVGPVKLA